jgi:hypothetical protein
MARLRLRTASSAPPWRSDECLASSHGNAPADGWTLDGGLSWAHAKCDPNIPHDAPPSNIRCRGPFAGSGMWLDVVEGDGPVTFYKSMSRCRRPSWAGTRGHKSDALDTGLDCPAGPAMHRTNGPTSVRINPERYYSDSTHTREEVRTSSNWAHVRLFSSGNA